jgi:hypothetical protein
MPITISWEPGKNRISAKLLFDTETPDETTVKKISNILLIATSGGCPVVFTHSINTEKRDIFLIKKSNFEWSKVCIAIENAIKQELPDVLFKHKEKMC